MPFCLQTLTLFKCFNLRLSTYIYTSTARPTMNLFAPCGVHHPISIYMYHVTAFENGRASTIARKRMGRQRQQ